MGGLRASGADAQRVPRLHRPPRSHSRSRASRGRAGWGRRVTRVRKLPYKPRLTRTERREVIERAAAQLFAERGYEAVSMDDVALAADITKPTLYDHFTSKSA